MNISIGSPIANMRAYILDSNHEPVAPGVCGELFIAGAGLAKGYFDRDDLTAQRFIEVPCLPGERLYQTGDLARFDLSGEIFYMGRSDDQVKLRGYRIELGEIETCLNKHEGIRESVVSLYEDDQGQKFLVAYLRVTSKESVTFNKVRDYLSGLLPNYMIPNIFMYVDALSLTPTGKIDRKALPSPSVDRANLTATYVAPRNRMEEELAEMWVALLKVKKVGVRDKFFELGGHSLLATQLILRVRDAYGVSLPLVSLIEEPTVADMAINIQRLMERDSDTENSIEEVSAIESQEADVDVENLNEDELNAMLSSMMEQE
jgi:acyl carrier protein